MITRFRVQNYKALRDVTLDLTPIHVLIGPNDSGKTSILEAIAALSRSVREKTRGWFQGRWAGDALLFHHADSDEVTLCAKVDGLIYDVALQFAVGEGDPELVRETIRSEDANFELVHEQHGTAVRRFLVSKSNSGKHYSPEERRLVQSVLHNLDGVRLHRWIPNHLALPLALDASRRYRMHSSGLGLVLCLDDILGFDRNRFSELENAFRTLFPDVQSIKLEQEQAYKSPLKDTAEVPMFSKADGKGIQFQFADSERLVPASQMSDGALLVLAYLTLLHLPEPPHFLLVEEPENGIHPGRLKEVLNILREIVAKQSHTQVILTTHSPYVVDLFQPEEVTLCYKGADGAVQIRRLSESAEVRKQIDFFTLGEIWTGAGDEKLLEKAAAEEQVETGP